MSVFDRAEYILDGRRYRWSGWFGCQLESLEWRTVPAGTTRELLGREFRVFRTRREGFRVRTTWALAISGRIDHCNKQIRALREDLSRLW